MVQVSFDSKRSEYSRQSRSRNTLAASPAPSSARHERRSGSRRTYWSSCLPESDTSSALPSCHPRVRLTPRLTGSRVYRRSGGAAC
jgi:hypothetical protein